jgi:hypothetical protein
MRGSIWLRYAGVIVEAIRRQREHHRREVQKLRRMFCESERLRAELSHLEQEIYRLRDAKGPSVQKALVEQALRVRYNRVEAEMLYRQNEITASGHLWNSG